MACQCSLLARHLRDASGNDDYGVDSMKVQMDKLGRLFAQAILPFVVGQLINLVEEIIHVDIDKDGNVGFEKGGSDASSS